jgi:hypothetical protein
MPPFLLTLLPKALPFLGKFKKPLLYVAIVAVIFAAGWQVNGWRWENKMLDARIKASELVMTAVKRREAELREQYKDQLTKVMLIREDLQDQLAEIHSRNSALSAEIETRSLTKPVDVTCTDNATGQVHEVQPNPFSASFVDIWNAAGRVRND